MALADIPVIYLVGAPRSGTTWLQRMLGTHRDIATPYELGFFSRFVRPWYDEWDYHCGRNGPSHKPPFHGLPAAITESDFTEAVRSVVERIYRSVLAAKPTASIVLEKDPNYSLCVETICRTVTHARFIHLVRDGRDVVNSLVRVARTWAADWAPPTVPAATEYWRRSVLGARTAADAPGGYIEVRYEDLFAERGVDILVALLGFCGVAATSSEASALYERYRVRPEGTLMTGGMVWTGEGGLSGQNVRAHAPDFIGDPAPGAWRASLCDQDRLSFDEKAGDLLIDLGYESDHSWA